MGGWVWGEGVRGWGRGGWGKGTKLWKGIIISRVQYCITIQCIKLTNKNVNAVGRVSKTPNSGLIIGNFLNIFKFRTAMFKIALKGCVGYFILVVL